MKNNGARLRLKAELIARCGSIANANIRLGRLKGDQRLYRLVASYAVPTDEERRQLSWLCQRPIKVLFDGE